MKPPDADAWQRTSPFAILFFIGRIVRQLAQNAWQALAPLAAIALAREGDLAAKALFAGTALAIFIAVAAVLSYWFFRFTVDAGAVRIRQGVFRRKQVDIRFDRIQGINVEQNPVFRLLGLVTVGFDTAGSSGSEGRLPAVPRAFASALRARIGAGDGTAGELDRPAAEPLLRLDWRDMVRVGLADRRALVVLALIGPFAEQLDDRIEQAVANYLEDVAGGVQELSLAGSALVVAGFVGALLLVLALISIAAAFLRYHGYELRLEGRTLRSTGGLLTRHEQSLEPGKIQMLIQRQGLVERWQKRFRMTARQAVSGRRQPGATPFTIPTITASRADEFRRLVLAPEAGRLSQDPHGSFTPVSRRYLRGRVLFVGLLPSLIAAVLLWVPAGPAALIALAWFPLVVLGAWQNWRRTGYQVDADEIIRRSGLIGFRTVGTLLRKVQRVTISRSRYQRRHSLASLRLYTAAGSIRIPYIRHDTARQIRDYVLYRVESSDKAWH